MKSKFIYLVLFIYAALAVFSAFYFDGTGDSGDSIHHYLFAKYAPQHPALFFNHWAKPLFVLLASPFAQFGFIGMKLFNVLISLLSIFFTFKSAEKLNLKQPQLAAVFMMLMPLNYVLTFSGLTEPLCALFVAAALYYTLTQKHFVACLILSFMPFVRSEGLLIMGVFAGYLLLVKQWKYLPLLITGHVVYSLAGALAHSDVLWVFNKIPYARLSSNYGHGTLTHFFEQLTYVVGVPLYVLFWLGVIAIIYKSLKQQSNLQMQILILGGFVCFFVAHSLFWYLGIFNSMGLKRVFIGVAPLMALIALTGYVFLTEELLHKNIKIKNAVQIVVLVYILIFPFTGNPAAINWKKQMHLRDEQALAQQVVSAVIAEHGKGHRIVSAHPYISEIMHLDHFDQTQRLELIKPNLSQLKSGDIIIWENWFALVECTVTKEQLNSDPELTSLQIARTNDSGREIEYRVYLKK